MVNRTPVSRRLRYEVLRRDNHACRYCGATAPDAPLTVDHVVPVALGGPSTPENLVTACRDCNAGKSSTAPDATLVGDVMVDATRWAKAAAAARQERAQARHSDDGEVIAIAGLIEEAFASRHARDVLDSVRVWYDAGLRWQDFQDAIDATYARPREAYWRYFCGVCWTMVRQHTERTEAIYGAMS